MGEEYVRSSRADGGERGRCCEYGVREEKSFFSYTTVVRAGCVRGDGGAGDCGGGR